MGYRLKTGRLGEEVRRVADEELGAAIAALRMHDTAAGVHEARRRLKRLRALVRLARAPLGRRYRAENRRFRDYARRFAAPRDARVMAETFDRLFPGARSREVVALRELLEGEITVVTPRESAVRAQMERAAGELAAARRRVKRWPIRSAAAFPELEPGLRRTYRRGRRALWKAGVDRAPESFHDWRKRVKYQREHVRFFEPLWRGPLKLRRKGLGRLGALLGEAHDLATLHGRLSRAVDDEAIAHVEPRALEVLDARRRELEAQALPLGRRLFADGPRAFTRRMSAYWDGWIEESDR